MLECLLRASESLGLVKKPHEEMRAEHDAVDLERDLLGIDIGTKVAFLDRDARGFGELVDPVLLSADQSVVRWAGTIVELGARTDEETAAWATAPSQPALEERAQTRFAARMTQRGNHHFLYELPRGFLDHRDLERFLRT